MGIECVGDLSEVAFGVWMPRLRPFALMVAVAYQILLINIFGMGSLLWVMIFGLTAFIDWQAIWQRFRQWLGNVKRPRLPLVSVGSAWAMQKSKVSIKPRVDEDTMAMDIRPVK